MTNRPALEGEQTPAFPSKTTLAGELDISESKADDWRRRDHAVGAING